MDLIKKLTGKNQKDYEQAAAHIVDGADVKSFKELVSKEDFLFDFIKQNVAKRLKNACNKHNYKNLIEFLKYYSPSYDNFIAQVLADFGDNKISNKMYHLLENGSDNEKAYCAKYFAITKNTIAIDALKKYAYSEFEPLSINCALALSSMNEHSSLKEATLKLNSEDDFVVLSAVKFISAYGETTLLPDIFNVMKKSSMSEFIACEIGYMTSFLELLNTEQHNNTLLAINNILQGLGEIIPLSDIFTFQLYEVFEKLVYSEPNSKNAIILLSAKNKFNQLTENDEYIFDEDKNTKDEINEIKNFLNDNINDNLDEFIIVELHEESDFVSTAVDLIKNSELLKPLLNSTNQTLLLKTLETLKSLNNLTQSDKEIALKNITNEDIKSIVIAL